MGRCWSCGSMLAEFRFTCRVCEGLDLIKTIQSGVGDLGDATRRGFETLASACSEMTGAISRISDEIASLASAIEWGLSEVRWMVQQQTQVLMEIDKTLKTPRQTQANECRIMAEQLRERGCLTEAEEMFSESLKANPLDYRTYIGLAMTHLRGNELDRARDVLQRSMVHAPKCTLLVINAGSALGQKLRGMGPWGTKTDYLVPGQRGSPAALLEKYFETGRRPSEMPEGEKGLRVLLTCRTSATEGDFSQIQTFPFDYRSVSFRLIGRTFACQDDWAKAESSLRSAIDLTPDYPEANYEYAQYCVQAGRGYMEWIAPLRRAIQAKPVLRSMALTERNFAPVRTKLMAELGG